MIEDIKKELLSDVEETRRSAVERLAPLKDAQCVPLAVFALGDESWRVRKTAASLLTESLAEVIGMDELTAALIEALRSEDNAGLRNSSAEVLTSLATQALPYLVETLDDDGSDIRKFAADIIGDICSGACSTGDCPEDVLKAVSALTNTLSDPDDNVRGSASEALGKIGGPGVIDALISALTQDDLWLRFSALEALAKIGTGVPVAPLVPFLANAVLRKAAIDALGATLKHEAIEHLNSALADKRAATRTAAVVNIARIYEGLSAEARAAVEPRIAELADIELLTELLDSPSAVVKKAAIVLLGITNAFKGADVDAEKILSLAVDETLNEAIAASFKMMGAKGLELVTSAFPKADEKTRSFICAVLGAMNDKAAVPTLLVALIDPYGHTRQKSLLALGELKAHDALDKILPLLDDEYLDVQEAAVGALMTIGREFPNDVIRVVAERIKDGDATTRKNLTTILGSLGVKEVLAEVAASLRDEDTEVRKAAASALGSLAFAEGLTHLTVALVDEQTSVRTAAVQALSNFKDAAEAEKLLTLSASDKNMWIRCAALKGLAAFETDGSFSTLSAAVTDEVAPVAITAINSISTMTKRPKGGVAAALKKALAHQDPQVVKSAEQKLSELEG